MLFRSGKMDFYNQHGYKIPIPDHPFFLDISNKNSDIKFVEAPYFKEIAQANIIDVENKAIINKTEKRPVLMVRIDNFQLTSFFTMKGFQIATAVNKAGIRKSDP